MSKFFIRTPKEKHNYSHLMSNDSEKTKALTLGGQAI